MITQSINLNLIPGAVPPRIKVSQYDYGSRTLQFTLYNGTTTFTQAGLSARIQGTKPDGKGFSYDATYGSGIVTADITRQMTACAGAVTCELVIVNEELEEELGTGNFILDVEAAALSEDTDISETEIPAIIDAAETNAERAEAAAESAEAASAHAPYIGDNEHWYVWDSVQEQYVDSGVDAEGVDGVGIVSIAKTSTVGLVDTYTITLSNGNTSTFTVTNGAEATLPSGGTAGQALIKNSSTASDASWKDISTTGAIKWTQAEGSVKKNLLKNAAVSKTENGVTFTVNSDGTINIDTGSGSATANAGVHVIDSGTPAGEAFRAAVLGKEIIMNGCPNGGGASSFQLFFYNYDGNGGNKVSYGDEVKFTFSNASATFNVSITAFNGASISNKVFSPMIRLSSITDSTYAPYIPGNTELVSWEAASGDVQKNLLQNSASTATIQGVTFTVGDDGSVTANRASSASYTASCVMYEGPIKPFKGCALSGCPSGGSLSTYFIQVAMKSSPYTVFANDVGNGAIIPSTMSDDTVVQIFVCIDKNYNVSNKKFYPMIRNANVLDPAYAPYVPSNSELQGEIDNALKYIRELTSADNMNDIKGNGIYQIRVSAPTNSPEGKTQCTVFVTSSADGVYTCQIVVRPSDGFIYTRRCLSGSWDGWYKIAGTLVQ